MMIITKVIEIKREKEVERRKRKGIKTETEAGTEVMTVTGAGIEGMTVTAA